jgi:hypothetical protein
MVPLLIAATLVSLVIALVASVVAWRASQQEKRRSAARVAALAAAAEVPLAAESVDSVVKVRRTVGEPPAAAPWRSPAAGEAPSLNLTFARDSASSVSTQPASGAEAIRLNAGFLGSEPQVKEASGHQRWLAAAAAIVAVLLGGFVVVRMNNHARPVVTAQQASTPLELLSLRHEREGVNLSVAGLVRNPAAAQVVERVSAVVFLFDQQGQFVTSAKAPIDFLKLTAGDESPFVVKVAAPQSVARYRVSFRTDDGTLPHVDRRGEAPVASPVVLTRQ